MIKQATINDIPVLNALNQEVQALHYKIFPKKFKPSSIADMSEIFKKFLEDENSTSLIAYSEDNEPIGYILFEDKKYKESGFTFAYRSLYIHHISLNKEFQGKGIGKKLMQEVIDRARELNIDCVELDVWSQNIKAKEFFKNLGFKAFNEKMSLDV